MSNDHLTVREVATINENLRGINAAAECLTQEIRKAKNAHDDAAYKKSWDDREALFMKAAELQREKTTRLRSMHQAGRAISDEMLEPSRTMHRVL